MDKRIFKKHLFIVLISLSFSLNGQNELFTKQLDSIHRLRQLSEDLDLDIEIKIEHGKRAVELSKITKVDSVILKSERSLAWVYLHDVKYFKESKRLLHKNLKDNSKLKDSIGIFYASNFLGYIHEHSKNRIDSAYYYYYNALKYSENKVFKQMTKHRLAKSETFNAISRLQNNDHDYLGSQMSTIQGINLLFTVPESNESLIFLSELYNTMGLSLRKLKEFDRAIDYYQKALITTDFSNKLYIYINMAEAYKEMGDYQRALIIYDELLEDKTLHKKDPSSYGAILNNLAYSMFLAKSGDIKNIDSLFKKAYSIFEDLNLAYELSAGGNDMAEFYYENDKKEEALYYTKVALKKGKGFREFEQVLRSLKMLSKLKEGEAGKGYLYRYIELKDSLIDKERANRNKFARIQFETDQYIEETKRLSTRNILILVIASILVLVLGLMYFIKQQHAKNKELVFTSEQEKANQEIYKLIVKQQTKQEEGRLEERNRIAEDLHDGILSRLFGTRMGMGFLDIKSDEKTLEEYQSFMEELQQIEKEVRDISHELKTDKTYLETNFKLILNQYIKTQSLIGDFKFRVDYPEKLNFNELNEETRVEVYRVIQEALQNIVKHSRARDVNISFVLKDNMLKVLIEDDGIGFKTKGTPKGIGLKNIESRLTRIGGGFNIISLVNKGTTLHIEIPL